MKEAITQRKGIGENHHTQRQCDVTAHIVECERGSGGVRLGTGRSWAIIVSSW